jgi:hypothetical protein
MIGHTVNNPYRTALLSQLLGHKLMYFAFDIAMNNRRSFFGCPNGMYPYFIK